MLLMITGIRPCTLLLVWLVFSFNAGFPSALQVCDVGPRRQAQSRAYGRAAGFIPVPRIHNTGSQGPSSRSGAFTSELSAFAGGGGEAMDSTSGRGASKRLALVRLSAIAAALLLASKSLAPSLQGLFQSYNQCLTTNPLITKVMTGAVLATVGDALAQSREKDKPYDARRAASFATFDSCYRMFQHVAFPFIIGNCQGRFLSSILSAVPGLAARTSGMTSFLAVCERVVTYQMMVVPLLYYPIFFTFTGFMQGLNVKETFQRAQAKFLPCWRTNLMFWVPVQGFMFAFVPTKLQVSFTCVMGIIWSLILSVIAGKAKRD